LPILTIFLAMLVAVLGGGWLFAERRVRATKNELENARERTHREVAVASPDRPSVVPVRDAYTALEECLNRRSEASKATMESNQRSEDGAKATAAILTEFGADLDVATTALGTVVRTVDVVAHDVDGLADQVARVTSSIGELAASVSQVAASSEQLAALSSPADAKAQDGAQAMERLARSTHVMTADIARAGTQVGELGAASERIGTITDAIDAIADQTNLLALNAAIEAARAGDAGRGFAVVAEEIRKLADGAAKSTSEIRLLIKDIQEKTSDVVGAITASGRQAENGLNLVDAANAGILEISRDVKQVSAVIDSISAAAREQASAAFAIVDAAEGMNNLTQNAARVLRDQRDSNDGFLRTVERITGAAQRAEASIGQQREAFEDQRVAIAVVKDLNREVEETRGAVRSALADVEATPISRPVSLALAS
jgi:methyl-accepting chemotaxis protein